VSRYKNYQAVKFIGVTRIPKDYHVYQHTFFHFSCLYIPHNFPVCIISKPKLILNLIKCYVTIWLQVLREHFNEFKTYTTLAGPKAI